MEKKIRPRRSSNKPWTAEEDKTLCNMWPDYSVRAIKQALRGRSWDSIIHRARFHKLGRRFQGYVSVEKAAQHIGFSPAWIFKKIKEGKVQTYTIGVGKKLKRVAIELEPLEELIKKELKLETFSDAAKRYGMSSSHLQAIFKRLGKYKAPTKKKQWQRLDPTEVDAVMLQWKEHLKSVYAARAAHLNQFRSKRTASPAGSIACLNTKRKATTKASSSSSSVSESMRGQAA